jgi:hypothetical protein
VFKAWEFDYNDGYEPNFPRKAPTAILWHDLVRGREQPGVLYKVTPAGKITLLHTFAGPNGEYPASRKPSSISNSIARNEQNRRRLG